MVTEIQPRQLLLSSPLPFPSLLSNAHRIPFTKIFHYPRLPQTWTFNPKPSKTTIHLYTHSTSPLHRPAYPKLRVTWLPSQLLLLLLLLLILGRLTYWNDKRTTTPEAKSNFTVRLQPAAADLSKNSCHVTAYNTIWARRLPDRQQESKGSTKNGGWSATKLQPLRSQTATFFGTRDSTQEASQPAASGRSVLMRSFATCSYWKLKLGL